MFIARGVSPDFDEPRRGVMFQDIALLRSATAKRAREL